MSNPIREFAIEVRERGDAAVASASEVVRALMSLQTANGVILPHDIERVLRSVEVRSGQPAAEFARRLVAVSSDEGELHADALHYLEQWLAFFDGHRPLDVLVDPGLLPAMPRRLTPKER